MPRLYLLLLRSFLGPFLATFSITLFVLVMQFLFKYIDDLAGKGLDTAVIIELVGYSALTLIPMAMPLGILLASIMTFGSMGENYELVAIRSGGIPLTRIMYPFVGTSLLLGVCTFFVSNELVPYSNLKMGSLLYDLQRTKPAFNIQPGEFYRGIEGYAIRVGKKHNDNRTLEDILVYDHHQDPGNNTVLAAQWGQIYKSGDGRYLILKLRDGVRYEEQPSPDRKDLRKNHLRVAFSEHEVKFDLSGFNVDRTDENLFRNHYRMLDLRQLQHAVDTMERDFQKEYGDLRLYMQSLFAFWPDSLQGDPQLQLSESIGPITDGLDHPALGSLALPKDPELAFQVLERARTMMRSGMGYTGSALEDLRHLELRINRYQIEWHRKFSLSFACLVLMLIGAPLGAIIRRGGLGLPLVVAIFLFVIYHVLSLTGEKLAREGVLPVWGGMWLSSFIMLPAGWWLVWRISTDSQQFQLEGWTLWLKNQYQKLRSRKGSLTPKKIHAG